jgi:hypothetical protein
MKGLDDLAAWFLRFFLCLALILACGAKPAEAGVLYNLSTPIILNSGASDGAAVWADYDNDGDLDLLVTGLGIEQSQTTIFENINGKVFSESSNGLPNLEESSAAWGDYNNDGYVDLAIAGWVSFSGGQIHGLAQIYKNNGNKTFSLNTSVSLPEIYNGSIDWGDYNNDGRLDLLLTGYVTGGSMITEIYRNKGDGTFDRTVTSLSGSGAPVGAGASKALWGDYNNDDYIDFVLIGMTEKGPKTYIYQNSRSASSPFFNLVAELPGVWDGSVNWVDVNGDGYLDLFITGIQSTDPSPGANKIPFTGLFRYENSKNSFTQITTAIPALWGGSSAWGDYDNDGDLDLLVHGKTLTETITQIYRNDSGTSFPIVENLSDVRGSGFSVAWGNFDSTPANPNNNIDFAISGVDAGSTYQTRLYPNVKQPANSLPGVPTLESVCWDPNSDRVVFDWSDVPDSQTGKQAMTYNLRLGTTPNGVEVISPAVDLQTGFYRLARPGSLFSRSAATLRFLPYRTYYWSVQAVDASFAAGQFSVEKSFPLGTHIGYNDIVATTEDHSVQIDVLTNDNGNVGPLTILPPPSDPPNGTAALRNNKITYTPSTGFLGVDTFYYNVRTEGGYCSRAYVMVIVVPTGKNAPVDLLLDTTSVLENRPAGTSVGKFTTIDPDDPTNLGTYIYTLVDESGTTDNAQFAIVGNTLQTAAVFDYESKSSYSIRIQTEDITGKTFEKQFTIAVINVMEFAPDIQVDGVSVSSVNVAMSEDGINDAGSPDPFVLNVSAQDGDIGDQITWSITTLPEHGTAVAGPATVSGAPASIQYTPEADWFGEVSFTVQASDLSGNTDLLQVLVTVEPVNDPPTIDPLSDRSLLEKSGLNRVDLTGISPGPANENQTVTVSAMTDNPGLLTDLQVNYTGGSTAQLTFTLLEGAGAANITITVDDGMTQVKRSFQITVRQQVGTLYLPIIEKGY